MIDIENFYYHIASSAGRCRLEEGEYKALTADEHNVKDMVILHWINEKQ